MLLEGVFAAVPTPFYPDERVYLRKLEANVVRYSRSLMAGMLVLGATGEGAHLSDSEAVAVLNAAAEAAAPEKVLIAGVSRQSVQATLELVHVAEQADYDAVLVAPPSAYNTSDSTTRQYFFSIADRSSLPVVIDQQGAVTLSLEQVAELAQHPNIIGMIDSSSDVHRFAALVEVTRKAPQRTVTVTTIFEAVTNRMLKASAPALSLVSSSDLASGQAVATAVASAPTLKTRTKNVGFAVLSSNGSNFLDAIENGASGAVLAAAAFVPQACQEVYMAFKDHDLKLAHQKQDALKPVNSCIVEELGIAGIKYSCDYNGFAGHYPRRPLLPLTRVQKDAVEVLLLSARH